MNPQTRGASPAGTAITSDACGIENRKTIFPLQCLLSSFRPTVPFADRPENKDDGDPKAGTSVEALHEVDAGLFK